MAVYKRWTISDAGTTYTFTHNPNGMTSPFGERTISIKATTAVDGQVLLAEGTRIPVEWTFTGDILDATSYEDLRAWVYERPGRRVIVSDHFGRRIQCVLKKFDATPKRAVGKYWRHEYTITAVVISVSAPTVGEVPA